MSDTERDTQPPEPMTAAERAALDAFTQLDTKVSRIQLTLEDIYGLLLEDRQERTHLRERVAALEAIPARTRTIPPPPMNGHDPDA